MWKSISTIAMLTVAAGASAAAPATDERMAAPALTGFAVGYNAANAEQAITEQVPVRETVDRWTRMVTTQRFNGLAARTTPAAYARTILDQLPRSCPGAKASPVVNLPVSGRPAARFQVDCSHSTGGLPETFMLLAIAGKSTMYVKQVAFRGRFGATDLAWGRGFLDGIALCSPRDRQPACQ
jgi:hypothetical protein